MAENVTVNPGSGGATIAADEIGSVHYSRGKITLGADGVNDGDVSSANPLPVTAGSLPLPSGAATAARQDTGNTSLSSIDGKITAVNTGAVVIASSALPSGAATSAAQTTGNSSLSAINTATGAQTDVEATADGSVVAILKRLRTLLGLLGLDATIQAVRDRLPSALVGGRLDVNVGASALPSGASTAAKQPALGTAGTASADVISVQGVASMTALKTDASATTQPVSGTVTANLGTLNGAATSAKQDTIIGHVDGLEGLLTTIDDDTGNMATSVALIDTKTPALGQALAAASVPVVLTAAQITTLTPPAAIAGFATAANQATIIGHVDGLEGLLTTIDADTGNISTKIDTLAGAVAGLEMQVDVVTSALPTGAATAANQATEISALAAIFAAVDVLDNTVAGSEMQVDIVGALPAGTNSIGKLAANSGVDIGDVDVTSVPADPFGANADAGSATGSISAKLRFIAATGIPITGTVTVGSHAVTNAGTFATQATLQTGTNAVGRVGHDTTGLGHGVTTVTTAGTDVVLAGSTACKWVIIQSQTDNTSLIAVGATGVDAAEAAGTGIILEPGETVTIPIDNLADVFIDSLVSGEGVRYTYGT